MSQHFYEPGCVFFLRETIVPIFPNAVTMKPFTVTWNMRYFAFIRPRTHLVYTRITCNFASSQLRRCFIYLNSFVVVVASNWAATDEPQALHQPRHTRHSLHVGSGAGCVMYTLVYTGGETFAQYHQCLTRDHSLSRCGACAMNSPPMPPVANLTNVASHNKPWIVT